MWHLRKRDVVDRPSRHRDLSGPVAALTSSPDWKVRLEAVEELGRLGDETVRGVLEAAKSDSSPEVRSAAHAACGDISVREVEEKLAGRSTREQSKDERIADLYLKSLGKK